MQEIDLYSTKQNRPNNVPEAGNVQPNPYDAVTDGGNTGFNDHTQFTGFTEFGDINTSPELSQGVNFDGEVAGSDARSKKIKDLTLGSVAAVLVAILGYLMVDTGIVPMPNFIQILGIESWFVEEPALEEAFPAIPEPGQELVQEEVIDENPEDPLVQTEPMVQSFMENPYWLLPNDIDAEVLPMQPSWTAQEEDSWIAGINHIYPYQRYKTVMETIAARREGSEAVLFDALSETKFWTRMRAAIGLAEFGIKLPLQQMEALFVGTRPSLIANFFKRFIDGHSPAELFVMRRVLRVSDARTRKVILRVIHTSRDRYRNLYLVAGSFDPIIGGWVRQKGFLAGIGSAELSALEKSIRTSGGESADLTQDVTETFLQGNNETESANKVEADITIDAGTAAQPQIDDVEFFDDGSSAGESGINQDAVEIFEVDEQ